MTLTRRAGRVERQQRGEFKLLTGTPTVLPRNFGVNTLKFSGGTVTLADSLKTGFVVVDGASAHLKLNGHYVGLTADFTTQNGGVLEMTNTHDTLDVSSPDDVQWRQHDGPANARVHQRRQPRIHRA